VIVHCAINGAWIAAWSLPWGGKCGVGMQTRWAWTVATAAIYAAILLVSGQFGGAAEGAAFSPWLYAAGYTVFGGLLLGSVARWWRGGSAALWRPFMLSVGSFAAALEIWIHYKSSAAGVPVDRWMVALLGMLSVALLARLLPRRVIRWWLGMERRLHDADA
jgi:hypothetical protein